MANCAPCLQCEACWAFTAVGAIESAILIASGETVATLPIDLSEQQLIDCATIDAGFSSEGCNRGDFADAFLYAST